MVDSIRRQLTKVADFLITKISNITPHLTGVNEAPA